jgi:hypothetical protein
MHILILLLALATYAALSAQASNTAKISISSGPDRGVRAVELGSKNSNGEPTCSVLPRADRQAGNYFNGHFYPDLGNKPGLMEVVTAFNVGTGGSTNEASFAVTFVAGTGANMTLRAYEAETRPTRPAKGKASATFARVASGATAKVEGETAEGVKVTIEITCAAVANR